MGVKFVKPVAIELAKDKTLGERWVQDRISEDPSILGIGGDVFVRDKERRQPHAGRLDLLLEDRDTHQRYVVEIQLGSTDERHIIRCLEYWDIEQRRYPKLKHCAVLVAEDVTSRFLNVITLLNGHVPLIAIQMKAMKFGDGVALVCTRVVDEFEQGPVDDDEGRVERVDRSYWEERASSASMKTVDELLELARLCDKSVELNYNKHHIGMLVDGKPTNFIAFSPKKHFVKLALRMPRSQTVDEQIESSGIELVAYQSWGAYEIRVMPKDLDKHRALLGEWMKQSYDSFCL